MVMPTWSSEVQAFGSGLIGLGVITIGVQQFRVYARKLKLDLYQRRYEVFSALHAYMTTIWNPGTVSRKNEPEDESNERTAVSLTRLNNARIMAYEKKAESRFLFNDKTCKYIDEYVDEVSNFLTIRDLLRSNAMDGAPEEKQKLSEQHQERIAWMMNQYEPLVSASIPALKLDHAFGLPVWSRIASRLKPTAKR